MDVPTGVTMEFLALCYGMLLAATITASEWKWTSESRDTAEIQSPAQQRMFIPGDVTQSYVERVLSAVCCPKGRTFNVQTTACEPLTPVFSPSFPSSVKRPHLTRRGVITVPPNCPPEKVYDPETKICRDVW